MGAPTQYYVDPAINANSGTGTSGDPFGDLQYALNTLTRDATNGDQINIKAGTAEVLAAALTLATYGSPTEGVPLVLRGYTTTAGDGGIAEINCNGFTMWASNSYGFLYLAELQIHSFGNNNGINLSGAGQGVIYKCNIHKGASAPSGKVLVLVSGGCTVIGCHIHDAGTTGVGAQGGNVIFNYIKDCPTGINLAAASVTALKNIIVDSATGIILSADNTMAISNTVYSSTANTGAGINASNAAGTTRTIAINNIIEGYSGSGGKGIVNTGDVGLLGFNAFYNNATNESFADVILDLGNDGAPGASPFTSTSGGNFALLPGAGAGVIESAFPGTWYGPASTTNKAERGAVQNGAGTGGMVSISPHRGNIG